MAIFRSWRGVTVRRTRGRLFVAILCCASVIGCGASTYEQRLAETANYFDYEARVNSALVSQAWGSDVGITLRVPRQFALMQASVGAEDPTEGEGEAGTEGDAETKTEDEAEKAAADTGPGPVPQPSFVHQELPGLVGAWRAELNVAGEEQPVPGFLYVLTNYHMWLAREDDAAVDPVTFQSDVAYRIGSSLGAGTLALDDPRWETSRFPSAVGYVPQKRMTTTALQGDVDGRATEFSIYLYSVKDIQVVLFFVLPQSLDRPQPLQTAITHCLETLKVSDKTPTKKTKQRKSGRGF